MICLLCCFCGPQAGIIEEMLEDTFEGMEDEDEMEEAAEAEVDKILFDITAGKESLSVYDNCNRSCWFRMNAYTKG